MFSLGKDNKLLHKSDYTKVFQAKKTMYGRYFQVVYRQTSTTHARLGLGIAKKHHKLAVQRNRLKRIVREAFRTHVLQGLDVVVLSKPHPRTIPNAILFKDLQRLFNKLS